MKSDIKTYNLNTLDINTIELPKEEYNCFILCENTPPIDELLLEMINYSKLNWLHSCGEYQYLWEMKADKLLGESERNFKKGEYISTSSDRLDSFIKNLAFEHEEYYDDEIFSHKPILLFYDDEKLKDFIIKRVEKLLEEAGKYEEHANEEDYDYEKDFVLKERIELNAHTDKNRYYGIADVDDLIHEARVSLRQGGIAITDHNSTRSFISIYKKAKDKKNFKVLYGIDTETNWIDNVNLICRNNKGKRVINEFLTHLNAKEDKTVTYEGKNGISYITTERQKIIDDNRDNLLIGLSYHSNTTSNAFLDDQYINEIYEDIADCDYVEVAPLPTYKLFYPDETEENIKKAIKLIIDIAKEEEKLVVAVSSPYYIYNHQYQDFSILWQHFNGSKVPEDYDGHLFSTEEMRYAFDWLNDDNLVEEIVVTNTHKIADMCEDIEIIDDNYYAPIIENAYERLEKIVSKNVCDIYGENLDRIMKQRIETELKYIKDNNYASIYMLHYLVNEEEKKQGYSNGCRGSIGASLVAFLLGITKCNPLPPHYICPKCHTVIWENDVEDGFDLKSKICGNCQTTMKVDGHNIPLETFVGVDGTKTPDIDINTSVDFINQIEEIIKKVAPNNKVIKAGTYQSIGFKNAKSLISNYIQIDDQKNLNPRYINNLIDTVSNVVYDYSYAPHGFIIVPNNVNIEDYTPLNKVDDQICSFVEYYQLSDNFYKADILGHADMLALNFFKENNVNLNDINILDSKVFELFTDDNELNFIGVPEFGQNKKVIDLVRKVKPKKFSDLVKISTLSHGTCVWTDNGDDLFESGVELKDLLGSRDDVFNTLIKYSVNRTDAYEIMEIIRKGKGLTKKQEQIIKEHNLPDWFIDSCNKIKYMFPKAHAVGYVINALMLAWVKVYKPALFYTQHFNFRSECYELNTICGSYEQIDSKINELNNKEYTNQKEKDLLETLEIARDMAKRGIKLINKGVNDDDENIIFEVNEENESEIFCSSVVTA